jgi:hypothetical protein
MTIDDENYVLFMKNTIKKYIRVVAVFYESVMMYALLLLILKDILKVICTCQPLLGKADVISLSSYIDNDVCTKTKKK